MFFFSTHTDVIRMTNANVTSKTVLTRFRDIIYQTSTRAVHTLNVSSCKDVYNFLFYYRISLKWVWYFLSLKNYNLTFSNKAVGTIRFLFILSTSCLFGCPIAKPIQQDVEELCSYSNCVYAFWKIVGGSDIRLGSNIIHVFKRGVCKMDVVWNSMLNPIKSRWKGSDQEPIQSNSTSCPKHQTGKEHKQLRRHKKEPRHKKTYLRGLRPGQTQTSLNSFWDWLESWNFGFRKKRYYTI